MLAVLPDVMKVPLLSRIVSLQLRAPSAPVVCSYVMPLARGKVLGFAKSWEGGRAQGRRFEDKRDKLKRVLLPSFPHANRTVLLRLATG